jgi:hypothetical protein
MPYGFNDDKSKAQLGIYSKVVNVGAYTVASQAQKYIGLGSMPTGYVPIGMINSLTTTSGTALVSTIQITPNNEMYTRMHNVSTNQMNVSAHTVTVFFVKAPIPLS